MTKNAPDVLTFWFENLTPAQWWQKSDEVDSAISKKFTDTLRSASAGELFPWRHTPEGRLAEIIVLDQFPRNIHRNSPMAFATDGVALILAQEAVALNLHLELDPTRRAFMLLPYMHSESKLIHEEAVKLFNAEGLEDNYDFELRHKAIIDRFGRYPHRNEILGRQSTEEELAFLQEDGSSF